MARAERSDPQAEPSPDTSKAATQRPAAQRPSSSSTSRGPRDPLRDAVRALADTVERLAARHDADPEIRRNLDRTRELLGGDSDEGERRPRREDDASKSAPREGGGAPKDPRSTSRAPGSDDDDTKETQDDLQRAML